MMATTKKYWFLLFAATFTSFLTIKGHKEITKLKNQGFLTIFAL
jgi:hypothetical protein